MKTKVCTKCKTEKSLKLFPDDRRPRGNRDGTLSQCKACRVAYSAAWKRANPAKEREQRARNYAKNRDKIRAICARWYQENREWHCMNAQINHVLRGNR